jgi:hypothetical protein
VSDFWDQFTPPIAPLNSDYDDELWWQQAKFEHPRDFCRWCESELDGTPIGTIPIVWGADGLIIGGVAEGDPTPIRTTVIRWCRTCDRTPAQEATR